jgi:hypothetical protein
VDNESKKPYKRLLSKTCTIERENSPSENIAVSQDFCKISYCSLNCSKEFVNKTSVKNQASWQFPNSSLVFLI